VKSTQTGAVQKEFDIEEYTDPEYNPMIPHTLVLKPGGYWFWGRPSSRAYP
jgi:hypothetical protein